MTDFNLNSSLASGSNTPVQGGDIHPVSVLTERTGSLGKMAAER